MGFTGKSKSSSGSGGGGSSENWGMGLLLVFFQEDSHSHAAIADQNKLFSSSPSSIRRSNYNLLTKAQSTISVCALLVFISLLLFTLSTFEPSIKTNLTPPRRFLSQKPSPIKVHTHSEKKLLIRSNWFAKMWKQKPDTAKRTSVPAIALQGMGTLYMRGTRAMADLVVFHVGEDVEEDELRLFLRLLHRSGVTAKADSVFLFPSPVSSSRFGSVIREENDSFLKLLHRYSNLNSTGRISGSGFDVAPFMKVGKISKEKGMEEPLWGKKIRRFSNDSSEDELSKLSYGSVVGFEAAEIDPENSLAGFLDHVPMSLRRWACYPMLLGRVRRNFKHIMLVDLKNLLLVGDPIGRIRSKSTESVLLFTKPEPISSKHGRKSSEKPNSPHLLVNPAIVIGGARGVRRLANSVLVETARALMQRKKKNSVSDAGILSRLVNNEFILKNVKVITTTESIPEANTLAGISSNSATSWSAPEQTVIQLGNDIDYREINSVIMKKICLSDNRDSSVYSDC